MMMMMIRHHLGFYRPVWASLMVSSKIFQVVYIHLVCNSAKGSEVHLVTSPTQTPSSRARDAT